jgi:hypothetical protein
MIRTRRQFRYEIGATTASLLMASGDSKMPQRELGAATKPDLASSLTGFVAKMIKTRRKLTSAGNLRSGGMPGRRR